MPPTRKTPRKEPEAAAPQVPDPAVEAPVVPVSKIRIRDDSLPVRAGGHVLTERGWVLETEEAT